MHKNKEKEDVNLHVIFGFSIAEWGTIIASGSIIFGFLNSILRKNIKIPLDKVRNELADVRKQDSIKHEHINHKIHSLDKRVTKVEGRVDTWEKTKGE